MGSPTPLTTTPRSVTSVVNEAIQALQQAQGQTLPAPSTMPLQLVAMPEILGQGHIPKRPLGPAGTAIVSAWTAASASVRRDTILRGDGQLGAVGTVVPIPLALRVTDGLGRPVPGASVAFTVGTGGGKVTGSPVTTGSDGVAILSGWTLGTAGLNTVDAQVPGGAKVTFRAFAV